MNLRSPHQWVTTKIFDEGASSPFAARLMLQTFHFRHLLIRDSDEHKKFDQEYSSLLDNFMELKLAINNLSRLFELHLSEVNNGSAVHIHPNGQLSVIKPIDNQYRAYVKDFFIKGEMVISAIPRVGEVFGLKTGFFFGKPKKFQRESVKLRQDWGDNADSILNYLQAVRSGWYEAFNDFRNDIEHRSVKFPSIIYHRTSDSNINVILPTFPSGGLLEVLKELENSILELVEHCLLFFFSTKLSPGMLIKEIPADQRRPDVAVRYRLYMRFGDQDVPYGGSI